MGEYLHRPCTATTRRVTRAGTTTAARWRRCSAEGAPAGERIARPSTAGAGGLSWASATAPPPPPAHRAGRKPLHEQQYASHLKVGDDHARGQPAAARPKKVSGARGGVGDAPPVVRRREARGDGPAKAGGGARRDAGSRAQAEAVRANLAAEAAAKLSISDGAPPPPPRRSAAPDDAMRAAGARVPDAARRA